MSITRVGSAVELNESTSVNSRNVTMPAVEDGDAALLFVNVATGNTTFTITAAGLSQSFTAVDTAVTASGFTSQVFAVTDLDDSDSSETVTIGTSVSGSPTLMKVSGGLRVYRGGSPINIVSAFGKKNAGSTDSPSSPGAITGHEGAGQVHMVGMFRGSNSGGTTPNVSSLTVVAGQGVSDDFSAFTSGTASLSAMAVADDFTPLANGASIGPKIFDSDQSVQYAAWTIAIRPGNLNPLVSAGDNQVVPSGATVSMTGTATDPEDDLDSTVWSFTVHASDSAPSLTNGTTLTPTWTATTAGLYTLRLRATDGAGAVTDSYVTVTVTSTAARPNAVTAAGSYTNVGGAASIPAALADESDTTYAQSGAGPAGDTLTVTLQPTPAGAKTVKYALVCDSASPTVSCVVSLLQGTTVIASWTETAIGTSKIERTRVLSSSQNAAITDPLNLSLRFVATQD